MSTFKANNEKTKEYKLASNENACRGCGDIYLTYDIKVEVAKLEKSEDVVANPYYAYQCRKCLPKFNRIWSG